jgi:hypothetical protein
MIEAAASMDDGDDKTYLTTLILNQMKKDYLTWNKGQVADEIIIRDLEVISGHSLTIPENYKIPDVRELMPQQKSKTQGRHQGRPQDKYQSKQKKKKHKSNY